MCWIHPSSEDSPNARSITQMNREILIVVIASKMPDQSCASTAKTRQ
jgi:hypothetical protein